MERRRIHFRYNAFVTPSERDKNKLSIGAKPWRKIGLCLCNKFRGTQGKTAHRSKVWRESLLFRYIAFVTTSAGDKDKLSTGAKYGERESLLFRYITFVTTSERDKNKLSAEAKYGEREITF